MKTTSVLTLAGMAFAFMLAPAAAQTKLSRNEIINSLQGAQQKVDISADDLRKQARAYDQKLTKEFSAGDVALLRRMLRQLASMECPVDLET